MPNQNKCPLCGDFVEMSSMVCPDWYSNDTGILIRVFCNDNCGAYWIDGLEKNGQPVIEPAIDTVLKSLLDEDRLFMQQKTRALIDNDCWLIYGHENAKEDLVSYHTAKKACNLFGLSNVRLKISGDGFDFKNRIYTVETEQERFALRIHDVETDLDEIRSKVHWLQTLIQEAELIVPNPIQSQQNTFIEAVQLAGEKVRYCVLYRWIEGKTFAQLSESERTEVLIGNFGSTMAKMHRQAAKFTPPDWFQRPRYDLTTFHSRMAQYAKGKSNTELEEFYNITQQLEKTVSAIGEQPESVNLIHLETGSDNVLAQQSKAVLIDFREFGWGYQLGDIENARHMLKEDEFSTFLASYEKLYPIPPHLENHLNVIRSARKLANGWRPFDSPKII